MNYGHGVHVISNVEDMLFVESNVSGQIVPNR
jgi:hypothetical protein